MIPAFTVHSPSQSKDTCLCHFCASLNWTLIDLGYPNRITCPENEQHLKNNAISETKYQIIKNGTSAALFNLQFFTAGIFFIYACFNQFLYFQGETYQPRLMAVLQSFNKGNKRLSDSICIPYQALWHILLECTFSRM